MTFELTAVELMNLVNAVPDATAISFESGEIVFANIKMLHLFGYESGEIVGKPIEMLLPHRHRQIHPRLRKEFVQQNESREMGKGRELHALHKNGSEFPVEISLNTVETSRGKLVLSSIRDVSIHTQIKSSLTGILEDSLNEVFIFTADSLKFLQVNKGARKNLGYSMEELSHLTPVNIKPEFDANSFRTLIDSIHINRPEPLFIETVHKRKDGTTYPVELHLQRMNYEDNEVLVAIAMDITERRRLEQQLKQQNTELEEKVRSRTLQLQSATNVAEQATTAKTRFLAAASHDLRQPLQAITLYLSVLERRIEDSKNREVVRKTQSSLGSMGVLLESLLDLSKLDSGTVCADLSKFSLQDVIDRVISENEQLAIEKGLLLKCEPVDYLVYSDAALLQRIIDNYVSNAIRYTRSGSVRIFCTQHSTYVRVCVEDSGIGIPESALNSVFEEYYRLDNNSQGRQRGLGLGLAIVKQLAQLLKHNIHVSSVENKGSIFSVDVPVATELSAVIPDQPGRVGNWKSGSPVILLVDDEPAVLDATSLLLEAIEVIVHPAASAEIAIEKITAGLKPDLLITDYRLPGCTGFDVLEEIRKLCGDTVPAIIMTGDTSPNEIDVSAITDCELLIKPVNTDRLINFISKYCGG